MRIGKFTLKDVKTIISCTPERLKGTPLRNYKNCIVGSFKDRNGGGYNIYAVYLNGYVDTVAVDCYRDTIA